MNEQRFEPDELERLLALPEDHPERVRAERAGRLSAWTQMLDSFESPSDELLAPHDLAQAEAELAQRVERAMPTPVRPRAVRRDASWLTEWWTGGRRVALAAASVAIVAAAGWWTVGRLQERPAVRGSGGAQAIELRSAPAADGIELRWTPVAGATMYRLVFSGPDLAERARVDSLVGTRFMLRAGELPAGLANGESVRVEVVAVLAYDAIASKAVSIALP